MHLKLPGIRIRLIGITLICSLILPFTGTYVLLKHKQKQVRREVKRTLLRKIDPQQLVLLKFHHADLDRMVNWKHSKEFQFKDVMFDIVASERIGDTIAYRCWPDKSETELNKKLGRLVAFACGRLPESKQTEDKLSNFFRSFYFQEPMDHVNLLPIIAQWHLPDRDNCCSMSVDPPTPPPEKTIFKS
ncbi:MAG: hypothetical protein H6606_07880 [Flavobacteriales bacterium]|nr:hypothetical protein [Flavobacteriales bacterium]